MMKKLRQKSFSYLPKFTQLEKKTKKTKAPPNTLRSKARLSDFNIGWDLFIIVEEEGQKSCVETH